MYTPQPVLGEERRTEVEQKARTLLQSGRLRKLPRYGQSGTATEVCRLASGQLRWWPGSGSAGPYEDVLASDGCVRCSSSSTRG